jgi:hypothetical protein
MRKLTANPLESINVWVRPLKVWNNAYVTASMREVEPQHHRLPCVGKPTIVRHLRTLEPLLLLRIPASRELVCRRLLAFQFQIQMLPARKLALTLMNHNSMHVTRSIAIAINRPLFCQGSGTGVTILLCQSLGAIHKETDILTDHLGSFVHLRSSCQKQGY